MWLGPSPRPPFLPFLHSLRLHLFPPMTRVVLYRANPGRFIYSRLCYAMDPAHYGRFYSLMAYAFSWYRARKLTLISKASIVCNNER